MKKFSLAIIAATLLSSAPAWAESAHTVSCFDPTGQSISCSVERVVSNGTSQEPQRSPAGRSNAQPRQQQSAPPARQDPHCLNKSGDDRLKCVKLNAPMGS